MSDAKRLKESQKKFEKLLVGKTIKRVQWMDDIDMDALMWNDRPLLLILDDDSILVPQRDDEGNDGGAVNHIDADGKSTIIYTS